MSKRKGYRSGDVVWVRDVPDRNGNAKPDPRPLLIIEPDPIDAGYPLCCLGISTRPGEDEKDPSVEMPWDAATGGTTGLFEWCRVVLLWFVQVADQSQVVKRSGRVNADFLARVKAEREAARVFRR